MLVLLCFYILYKLKIIVKYVARNIMWIRYDVVINCFTPSCLVLPTLYQLLSPLSFMATYLYNINYSIFYYFIIPLYSMFCSLNSMLFHIVKYRFTSILLTFITYKLYSILYSLEHFLYGSSSVGKVV